VTTKSDKENIKCSKNSTLIKFEMNKTPHSR